MGEEIPDAPAGERPSLEAALSALGSEIRLETLRETIAEKP